MNTEQTLQQLKTLKLHGMATTYKAIADLPTHQQLEAHLLVARNYRIRNATSSRCEDEIFNTN